MSVAPVAISGMGCVCAAGARCADVQQRLFSGMPQPVMPHVLSLVGPGQLDAQALPYPFFPAPAELFAGAYADAGADAYGGRRGSTADTLHLAKHATLEAIRQAGLAERLAECEAKPQSMSRPMPRPMPRIGIVIGTTAGTALHFLRGYSARQQDPTVAAPDIDDFIHCNTGTALAAWLTSQLPPYAPGPVLTLSNACTSGADAVGIGAGLIRSGRCDLVICGGAEALSLVPHTGFARLTVASTQACHPYDRERQGLNLGEGAGIFVLESPEWAATATVLGHVCGYGAASDAHHFTAPHAEGRGLRAAMHKAMSEAGSRNMAFVNAHGTATRDNDLVEGKSVRACLPAVPLWASKGGTGHTLGAAGALEAVLCVLALQAGHIPPSPGFCEEDPEIGLSPTREATAITADKALSLSLGFGGGNAALVLQASKQPGAAS